MPLSILLHLTFHLHVISFHLTLTKYLLCISQWLRSGESEQHLVLIVSLLDSKLLRIPSLCSRKCGQPAFLLNVTSHLFSITHSISSPWNTCPLLCSKAYINFLGTNSNSISYLGPILTLNLIWGLFLWIPTFSSLILLLLA